MRRALGWTALATGVALILMCVGDVIQFTQFLHAHKLEWSLGIIRNNPAMPGRWALWLFVSAVLIGNGALAIREVKSL